MKRKKVRRNKTRQTMSGMLKIIRRKEIWQEPFMKESQKFLNGLDDAERAEVLYDVYAANVYQNGNGEDEQGRVLHRMFDQVIIENVSFK